MCKQCKRLFITFSVLAVIGSACGALIGFYIGYDSGRLGMAKSVSPLILEMQERQDELNQRIERLQKETADGRVLVNPFELK